MATVTRTVLFTTQLAILLDQFAAVSHAGCGHKISQSYLAGATNAEYPGTGNISTDRGQIILPIGLR